ncbi:ABC transporter substrate-binding protein [Paenibacillus sacheonensis]|uniref:Extracellular solute-binding protein n=1 Tax=Paenibacillus sacheonensis TaxID=742054 RepID=A0A7X4YSL5_9BACL|nr:ABC transporter substrate-binding protein [Paenibacillus sacheonensis]MBM7568216.1 ABC-type glycerol-3-phosphate transport system substrate-binding protein [Paenibacillus sacheonensis]NBC71786.1 extracellular solute-binding protein [Paenibacillus sacheonensis]
MNKLKTLPLTAGLAAVLLISGCDSARPKAANAGINSGSSADEQVTIDFWYPWGDAYPSEFKKNVIDVFEREHPNIKVKMTYVENTGSTQASDKLLTAIAGGTPPDVALFDRFLVGSWAARGYLEDLSSYVGTSGILPSDYYAPAWKEVVYDGKVYGLPWRVDDRAMYYNKTMMQAAGLDPDRPPKTLDELDRMAEKMFRQNEDGQYEQVGFVPWMNQAFFYVNAWNMGGSLQNSAGELTPNAPANVKALQWMAGYAKKYDVARLTSFAEGLGQTGVNLFWTNKVGFVYDGNWILDDLAAVKPSFEWGVAPMPSAEGKPRITWSGGWSYVMPKGAQHPKEAWEFIRFVAHKEGTLLWARRQNAGNDITAMPAVNDELKLADNPRLKIFLDMMPNAYTRPVTPVGSLLWNETQRIQELVIHGKGEPKQLLDELKKNVDKEIKKLEE